jgi:hypothetical protein
MVAYFFQLRCLGEQWYCSPSEACTVLPSVQEVVGGGSWDPRDYITLAFSSSDFLLGFSKEDTGRMSVGQEGGWAGLFPLCVTASGTAPRNGSLPGSLYLSGGGTVVSPWVPQQPCWSLNPAPTWRNSPFTDFP